MSKRCYYCQQVKDLSEFHLNRVTKGKDKVQSKCKKCCALIHNQWRKKHPDYMKNLSRQWRAEHPDYNKEYHREYRRKMKEKAHGN